MTACPDTIRVGSLRYRVLWDKDEIKKVSDEAHLDGTGAWNAFSDHDALVIGLNPDHALDASRMSMVHELLHCTLRVSGAWPNSYARLMAEARDRDGGIPVEEYTVGAQAAPLLAVLQDNPALVAWLTEDAA